MTRILIIGDARPRVLRVIRSIFEPLDKDFELHQFATRYEGHPHVMTTHLPHFGTSN